LANGVGIIDFWQKTLKTPLQQFGKQLGKIWQLGKNPPSPRIYGNLEKGLANPLPACMLHTDHENKVFSLLACCLLPFFHFAKSEIANYWRSNCFLLGK